MAALTNLSRRYCGKHFASINIWKMFYSTSGYRDIFKVSELKVIRTAEPKAVPPPDKLVFGSTFSDHMLAVEWNRESGWGSPEVKPLQNLSLHPGVSALHYGIQAFEGMKAFRGKDGVIRMFRPMENMKRLSDSAVALSLPAFDKQEFLSCIQELIKVDQQWIPDKEGCSLYVRPTYIATEESLGVKKAGKALLYTITCPVGPYFSSGLFTPISLYANPRYVRAWIGGTGDAKIGGNYGPTIRIAEKAEKLNCTQVLWLYGPNHQLTEVGTMNIFVHWINEVGEPEIATPPLNGLILPGVVRKSLIQLMREWSTHRVVEREITMSQIISSLKEGRLKEIFGAGTACVVCPVKSICYLDDELVIPEIEDTKSVAQRAYNELTSIQYGKKNHEWAVKVSN